MIIKSELKKNEKTYLDFNRMNLYSEQEYGVLSRCRGRPYGGGGGNAEAPRSVLTGFC